MLVTLTFYCHALGNDVTKSNIKNDTKSKRTLGQ